MAEHASGSVHRRDTRVGGGERERDIVHRVAGCRVSLEMKGRRRARVDGAGDAGPDAGGLEPGHADRHPTRLAAEHRRHARLARPHRGHQALGCHRHAIVGREPAYLAGGILTLGAVNLGGELEGRSDLQLQLGGRGHGVHSLLRVDGRRARDTQEQG